MKKINVAVIGPTSSGKSTLINAMKKYEIFCFEEYNMNEINSKQHDAYLYVFDFSQPIESQLLKLNKNLNNLFCIFTKTDSYLNNEENYKIIKQELLDKDIKIFFFSNDNLQNEINFLFLLRSIWENYIENIQNKFKRIDKFLDEINYYELEENEKNLIDFFCYNYMNNTNKKLVSDFIKKMDIGTNYFVNEEIKNLIYIYCYMKKETRKILIKIIEKSCIPQCIPMFQNICEEISFFSGEKNESYF